MDCFAACGRRTLRGFFDTLKSPSAEGGYISGGAALDGKWKIRIRGAAAGLVNGLFGGGGGTVLVPLLTAWCKVGQKRAMASCVAVILPLCALSAVIYLLRSGLQLLAALPYLVGGLAGGLVGGKLFRRVPGPWLRRIFGAFLVYGGVRYLL